MARASRTASPGSAEANGSGVGVVFQLCAASRKLWLPMTTMWPESPGAACTSSALTPLPQRRDRSLSGSIASNGASMAATPSTLPAASQTGPETVAVSLPVDASTRMLQDVSLRASAVVYHGRVRGS